MRPTARESEGGNTPVPSPFTLTLNAFKKKNIFLKKNIYLGWGGEFFVLFGFDKTGCGEFLSAVAPLCPYLGQLFKGGSPSRLGVLPPLPQDLLSLWLLPLFYEELRCCNFLEPQLFFVVVLFCFLNLGRFRGPDHFHP